MANNGRSTRGLLGSYKHYDSSGRKTGSSSRSAFGSYNHYDANGRKTGRSSPSTFGSYNHYDASGRKTGRSSPSAFGGYTHYDANGRRTGSSSRGIGGYNHRSDGCYIATCVYGSYDCPEVWTLRRFRDNTLALNAVGRLFIKIYYAVSPTLVRLLGNQAWFRNSWKYVLDRLTSSLWERGVADTPYQDRGW